MILRRYSLPVYDIWLFIWLSSYAFPYMSLNAPLKSPIVCIYHCEIFFSPFSQWHIDKYVACQNCSSFFSLIRFPFLYNNFISQFCIWFLIMCEAFCKVVVNSFFFYDSLVTSSHCHHSCHLLFFFQGYPSYSYNSLQVYVCVSACNCPFIIICPWR